MLKSEEIGLYFEKSNFEPFDIGIILLVFKIGGNNLKKKYWLNRNLIWSDLPLFNNFKVLVGILFGPSLLPRFKKEIIL